MQTQRAFIFANGSLAEPEFILKLLTPTDMLIAANGGSKHLSALGLIPHILIGDFDSLDEDILSKQGIMFFRHKPEKDETDLELALLYAHKQKVEEILIFGALGGRWDMCLANILLLANPIFHENLLSIPSIKIMEHNQELSLITQHSPYKIHGSRGDTISLLPISTYVEGVLTQGLHYPLNEERLRLGTTRGISNLMLAEQALVQIQNGLLLCIHTYPSLNC